MAAGHLIQTHAAPRAIFIVQYIYIQSEMGSWPTLLGETISHTSYEKESIHILLNICSKNLQNSFCHAPKWKRDNFLITSYLQVNSYNSVWINAWNKPGEFKGNVYLERHTKSQQFYTNLSNGVLYLCRKHYSAITKLNILKVGC